MNFLQLEYFLEVAAFGNVTRAAEHLHVSQSALSQMIRKLEEEFSVELFRRLPKKLELTQAGELFLEYAERTLAERDAITHRLRNPDGQLRGTIVIQSNPVPYLIADLFLKFRERHPLTEIQFVSRPELLLNDYSRDPFLSVSLLVTTEPPDGRYAESRFFCRERLMAALPRTHRLAQRACIGLPELREEPFLLYQDGEVKKAVEHSCIAAGFLPRVQHCCQDIGTMFNLVSSGSGVSLFPESWKQLCNEKTVFVPLEEDCARTIYLCWGKQNKPDAVSAAFRDYLLTQGQNREPERTQGGTTG